MKRGKTFGQKDNRDQREPRHVFSSHTTEQHTKHLTRPEPGKRAIKRDRTLYTLSPSTNHTAQKKPRDIPIQEINPTMQQNKIHERKKPLNSHTENSAKEKTQKEERK